MLEYVKLPTFLILALRKHPYATHILFVLGACRNLKTNRTHFMSIAAIANLTGISKRHTYRVLEKLEALNLLKLIATRRGEYMYQLNCFENVEGSQTQQEAELHRLLEAYNG